MDRLISLENKAHSIANFMLIASVIDDKGYLALALRKTEELTEQLKEQLK